MVQYRTDIGIPSHHTKGDGDTYKDGLDCDVLIVGAGFGGVYLLHRLRDELGLNVKIFEAGTDLGGIWHWNCYPGARVDTPVPAYELSFPEVWKDWTWSERYPAWPELRRYFDHCDKALNIKKDCAFNTRVTGADFDKEKHKWVVHTEDGRKATCKYFIQAVGFAAKRHFPDWTGLDKFQGEMFHSSFWPESGVDLKGKRIAVIGTGSTGIQISQDSSKAGAQVTVFQRTPNLCLPMRQTPLTAEEQQSQKHTYPQFFKDRLTTFGGFQFDFVKRNTFDDTEEQREAFYEQLWKDGGFRYWLATYQDMLFDNKANEQAYKFWVKKTRARITDPKKRDILAPLEAPHPWGTKRPSLEQDFYEQMDKPENEVVDIKATPVTGVDETGIITSDGKHREFDIIALATGFDSVTGGMKNMGLRDTNGVELGEKWKTGTWSNFGLTCNGYPNMFFLYGAQGPTAFSNGPSCVECQGGWIFDAIAKMQKEGIKSIEAKKESEEAWRQHVQDLIDKTLFAGVSSWYMGANVPGKPRESLNYAGGMPLYEEKIRESLDNNFQGFVVT